MNECYFPDTLANDDRHEGAYTNDYETVVDAYDSTFRLSTHPSNRALRFEDNVTTLAEHVSIFKYCTRPLS